MKKIKVQCSFILEVELSDSVDEYFAIEENSCPGTGVVGAALKRVMAEHKERSTCWACACQGENKVLEVKQA